MDSRVKTICPYCGVGCGLSVTVRDGRIVEVKGDKEHPSTLGGICQKGAQLEEIRSAPNRLTRPQLRHSRSAPFEPVGWDAALDHVSSRMSAIIREHGRDAVAFYVSGQLSTETQYVFNKLAKGAIGTNNIDANSRLCMSSAASAYKLAFGSDGPPTCYDDLDTAECFLILGANMAECHPVLWARIKRRLARKRVRVVVVDPRKTPTAAAAHLHLQIQPGTDVALLNSMLHVMISQGWISNRFIQRHTNGWDEVMAAVENWLPSRAAKVCGISELDIHRAAFWFGQSAEALSLWAMGANQSTSGVAKNLALINLHLATGKLGRAGSGPFSLTGQPNAMGGREVGYMSGLLPGYREVSNPVHREEIARIWGVPKERISPNPGLDAVRMFEALESGAVKAVWIAGCNPLATMPDAARVRRALEKAELVVVQDCYHPTETTPFADVLFPGAMNLEIDGTMTNSERRIGLMRSCVPPPGEARPDWEIVCRVAERLGFDEGFSYTSAQDIFEEHKRCCSGTYHMQMDGISYKRLGRSALQWPCPTVRTRGVARRYRNKRFPTPDGKARFNVVDYRPPADVLDAAHPLALTTGRLAPHWHTRTKTGHVAKLNKQASEPFVSVHPSDCERMNLQAGEEVRLVSPRGVACGRIALDDTVKVGTVFMSFHWGQSYREDGCVNVVTSPACDPISKEPELKFAAIRIEKVGVQ